MRCCAPLLLSVLLASVAGSADGETAVLAVPVPKSASARSHSLGVGVGVPILFEKNVGQADPRALYVARCGESVVYFGDSSVLFAVPDEGRTRVPTDIRAEEDCRAAHTLRDFSRFSLRARAHLTEGADV